MLKNSVANKGQASSQNLHFGSTVADPPERSNRRLHAKDKDWH